MAMPRVELFELSLKEAAEGVNEKVFCSVGHRQECFSVYSTRWLDVSLCCDSSFRGELELRGRLEALAVIRREGWSVRTHP
jgi:hypothetical protein